MNWEASRAVVVTGAFGALGSAVVRAFEDRGDRVALVDALPGAPPGTDGALVLAGVDLVDPGEAARAMNAAAASLGGIDVLANIAGGYAWERLGAGALDGLRRLFASNVETCLNASLAALAHMPDGGRIVNVGAAAAARATAGHWAYASAKSAVARLTEAMADELTGRRIAVNAVLPAIIDTPANRAAMPDADVSSWTAPAAVAEAILFLASDQARALSGALVPVTAAASQ